MAFNRDVRSPVVVVRTAGGAWVGGLGGWGSVDWIPASSVDVGASGVATADLNPSRHDLASALRSKLSLSRHGSCGNGQHQSRTFRTADSLSRRAQRGVLRSITAVSTQSLRLRVCGPRGDRNEKKNSTCIGTAAITSFCWLLLLSDPRVGGR